MGNKYNPESPFKYITYFDANNLYDGALSKSSPAYNFNLKTKEELDNRKKFSCMLKVNLEYSTSLPDLHNDYLLASESLNVNKVDKLILSLYDKSKYTIHYENLKLCESLGLKTTKISRGIKFKESLGLKMYIDSYTSLRAKATNNFEKNFFILMNNRMFGKTTENIRKGVDIKFVNTLRKIKKVCNEAKLQ